MFEANAPINTRDWSDYRRINGNFIDECSAARSVSAGNRLPEE